MAEDEIEINTVTQSQEHLSSDLGLLRMKIDDQLKVLVKYSHAEEPRSASRKELMDEFLRNVATYYEYSSELLRYFAQMFPPAELLEFLEANQMPRPVTIRTNTLKTKRRELAQYLIQRGVNLDPVGEWSKVGLKIIDSQVPIGATPEYLAGLYMLQAASSFLPVMALAPQPGEKVLDLCAAPGGKTTHIAQLMKNSGVLFANDVSAERLAGVRGNVQRMGVTNCIVTNFDGRRFPKVMAGFDRVLLDAPCSGLGVISKDQSIKSHRTLEDVKKNAHVQKELLLAAIDCCNARSSTGGFVVYSTCSVSVEENEEVVQYALKNRRVKLVDTGLPIGHDGFPRYREKVFDHKMTLCKRVYPHVHNMDGFFVAKLRKCDNALPEGASKPHSGEKRPKLREKGKRKEKIPDLVPADEQEELRAEVPSTEHLHSDTPQPEQQKKQRKEVEAAAVSGTSKPEKRRKESSAEVPTPSSEPAKPQKKPRTDTHSAPPQKKPKRGPS